MDYVPYVDSVNHAPPLPDGRPRGCNPRKSRPGEWFPMASERIAIVPRSEWAARAKEISLRPFVKTVLDQDGVGSCATEGAAQAIMIARAFAGLPHVALNPWSIYATTSGGRDAGSSIDENLRFIQQYGCCPMDAWPRSKGWRAKPDAAAMREAAKYKAIEVYDIASVDEMVSALLTGFAVVYGANGHCVVKVQHLDESKGLDVNSWSPSWGDEGFGVWATYRAVNWAYGAWALRVAEDA